MTIKQLPFQTQLTDPVKFDVSIYPVKALLTSDGVQYATMVENQSDVYSDLFSFDTHTFFPAAKGDLAWAHVSISFILWAGTGDPLVTWKVEAKSRDSAWTIMSEEETHQITTENSEATALVKRLEGYLLLGENINYVPFSIRLQFKSDSTAVEDKVSMRLKSNTVIRLVGSRDVL